MLVCLHRAIIAHRKEVAAALLCALLLAGCGGGETDGGQTATRPEIPRGGDNVQP
jgi:hypothetical protein